MNSFSLYFSYKKINYFWFGKQRSRPSTDLAAFKQFLLPGQVSEFHHESVSLGSPPPPPPPPLLVVCDIAWLTRCAYFSQQ